MIMLLVVACQAPNQPYAPVVDGWRQDKGDYYRVKAGDTLYAIAWYYDCDVRELAKMNHIASPYIIHAGEKIYFSARTRTSSSQKSFDSTPQRKVAPKIVPVGKGIASLKVAPGLWLLPTQGTVITHFDEQKLDNKGIDIAGVHRQPIYASLDGKVVYNGNGLIGYGNLIIIKHSEEYLSAYANNDINLVKEGEFVKRGQKIALMGKSSNQLPCVHFEIRYQGKPVNPMKYLNLT